MNEKLYNLGFYICKIENIPKYLNGISNKLISLSGCLCTYELQICLCHGWKSNGDNVGYMEKLGLTSKQYFADSFATEYGLIASDFLTVKEMCKSIRGIGEPVDWIPVIVFEQL